MPVSFEPLPLVIGVSGHRDLRDEDIETLKNKVAEIFDRLDRDYANRFSWLDWILEASDKARRFVLREPAKKPIKMPMIVLSQLAEGADQLVAEVAIEKSLDIIAPLPLPPDEYRRDFEQQAIRPDAVETFDGWMKRSGIRKLFVGYEKGSSPDDVRSFGEKRDLQYRRAGAFIARHCDVLIALWDGKDKEATGGTAEIVAFKRCGIPLNASRSGRASLDAPEIGPVIHVVTPRAATAGTATAVSVPPWGVQPVKQEIDAARRRSATRDEIDALEHDLQLWDFFKASVGQSREFNRAATGLLQSSKGPAKVEESLLYLFEADEKKPETKATALRAQDAVRRYCDLYVVADTIAQDWQKVFRRDWRWLFGLGLFAFGCFEAYSHLAPIAQEWEDTVPLSSRAVDRILLFGYIIAFVAIFGRSFVALWREHQERFLDYRAFAEALRVAVFWHLAGIEHVADAYPIKMPRELAWVKTCLLGQELLDTAAATRGVTSSWLNWADYNWLCRTWVDGQLGYFKRTRSRHLTAAGWRERWSTRILFAIAALAIVLLLVVLYVADNDDYGPVAGWLGRGEWAHDLFLFIIGILPGVAAYLVGLSEKLAFNAQARQYDRMAAVFGQAHEILPPRLIDVNADLVREVLRELGTEAMRENAEWVSIYRQRPIGLPPQ